MRKILLLLCIAFVVVAYGFPCLILPLGEYKYSQKVAGETIEYSYKFGFDGKVSLKSGKSENKLYYKLKGDEIIISEDKKFDTESGDLSVSINNLYTVSILGMKATNIIALITTAGVGVLALVLVLTIPKKKKS